VDHIQDLVDDLSEIPDVSAITVFDTQGQLIQTGTVAGLSPSQSRNHFGRAEHFSGRATVTTFLDDSITASVPVLLSEEIIGRVMVNLSMKPITQQVA
jgi:sensor histidine kinase regulating citrate/malate metabolism